MKIFLLGADKVHYGLCSSKIPLGQKALSLIQEHCLADHFRFVGHVDFNNYKRLLSLSHVICYPSLPFVPSWGLFHSSYTHSQLVYHRNPMTDELMSSDDSLVFPDHLPETIVSSLDHAVSFSQNSHSSRSSIKFHIFSDVINTWKSIFFDS